MSDNFLKNLKDSLDKGEFNSDIAKKLTEINELADKKIQGGMTSNDLEESLLNKAKEGGIKTVTEEEATEINQEYERKIEELKHEDAINKEVALLIEIEDAVKATIEDMFYHIEDVERKYVDDIEKNSPAIKNLSEKINVLKEKFKSIIN